MDAFQNPGVLNSWVIFYNLVLLLVTGCAAFNSQNRDGASENQRELVNEQQNQADAQQEPIPDEAALTFTEPEEQISKAHVPALKSRLRVSNINEVENSLYVVSEDKGIYTRAYVKSRPLMQAKLDMVTDSPENMERLRRKNLEERFQEHVTVKVEVISYDINALRLDEEEWFELYLEAEDRRVSPIEVNSGGITYHMFEKKPWYKSNINAKFPRYENGSDLWQNNEVYFIIEPGLEELSLDEGEYYRFRLPDGS